MIIENLLIGFIEQLNQKNQHRNIFYDEEDLILGDSVVLFFLKNLEEFKIYFSSCNEAEIIQIVNKLAEIATNELLKSLMKINQYLEITNDLKQAIYELYRYFNTIVIHKIAQNSLTLAELHNEVFNHQVKLRTIFQKYDELTIFKDKAKYIEHVPNYEYTKEFQLKIMHISLDSLKEPILDIGCGEHAELVNYLYDKGFTVLGIDRNVENSKVTKKCSWFEFDFTDRQFGTIFSHQSFGNHFLRQHYKTNGKIIEYSKLYLAILNSLISGGSFYYTPHLPFIENLLDSEAYSVETFCIKEPFYSVKVTKK